MKDALRRRATWVSLAAVTLAALVGAASATAAPPRNTAPPTIEGTYREGATLRTSRGSWANNPTSFRYQWLRCDNEDCRAISGATGRNYRLVARDVGRVIVAAVTAVNRDGSATARSAPTPAIAANVPPQSTQPPSIAGSPIVGSTLTGHPGGWTGSPTLSLLWHQCDAAGVGCVDTGARGSTYGVRSEDVGRTIRLFVRATNPRGTNTATSAQTDVVRTPGGGPVGPAVPVASVALPDRLVISGSSFRPRQIRNRRDTITLSVRVSDTRGRLVQGALVLAQGLPFGRVTSAPEATTNSSGIATIRMRPTARMPLVRGATLVFFLRARKPGDNVLAGVSTRRLVQVRIVPG